ncbi:Putative protein kinase C delta type -like protein [Sarcoptes scabiei]|uniref:Uncharacterized protein n=2 Tax=Sarcoptes scabiei TaxID=52283 RepID=A0A834R1M0_SARSC|nr:Putative protein kinase C delta type -like protein [Sarcoptes scabiei]
MYKDRGYYPSTSIYHHQSPTSGSISDWRNLKFHHPISSSSPSPSPSPTPINLSGSNERINALTLNRGKDGIFRPRNIFTSATEIDFDTSNRLSSRHLISPIQFNPRLAHLHSHSHHHHRREPNYSKSSTPEYSATLFSSSSPSPLSSSSSLTDISQQSSQHRYLSSPTGRLTPTSTASNATRNTDFYSNFNENLSYAGNKPISSSLPSSSSTTSTILPSTSSNYSNHHHHHHHHHQHQIHNYSPTSSPSSSTNSKTYKSNYLNNSNLNPSKYNFTTAYYAPKFRDRPLLSNLIQKFGPIHQRKSDSRNNNEQRFNSSLNKTFSDESNKTSPSSSHKGSIGSISTEIKKYSNDSSSVSQKNSVSSTDDTLPTATNRPALERNKFLIKFREHEKNEPLDRRKNSISWDIPYMGYQDHHPSIPDSIKEEAEISNGETSNDPTTITIKNNNNNKEILNENVVVNKSINKEKGLNDPIKNDGIVSNRDLRNVKSGSDKNLKTKIDLNNNDCTEKESNPILMKNKNKNEKIVLENGSVQNPLESAKIRSKSDRKNEVIIEDQNSYIIESNNNNDDDNRRTANINTLNDNKKSEKQSKKNIKSSKSLVEDSQIKTVTTKVIISQSDQFDEIKVTCDGTKQKSNDKDRIVLNDSEKKNFKVNKSNKSLLNVEDDKKRLKKSSTTSEILSIDSESNEKTNPKIPVLNVSDETVKQKQLKKLNPKLIESAEIQINIEKSKEIKSSKSSESLSRTAFDLSQSRSENNLLKTTIQTESSKTKSDLTTKAKKKKSNEEKLQSSKSKADDRTQLKNNLLVLKKDQSKERICAEKQSEIKSTKLLDRSTKETIISIDDKMKSLEPQKLANACSPKLSPKSDGNQKFSFGNNIIVQIESETSETIHLNRMKSNEKKSFDDRNESNEITKQTILIQSKSKEEDIKSKNLLKINDETQLKRTKSVSKKINENEIVSKSIGSKLSPSPSSSSIELRKEKSLPEVNLQSSKETRLSESEENKASILARSEKEESKKKKKKKTKDSITKICDTLTTITQQNDEKKTFGTKSNESDRISTKEISPKVSEKNDGTKKGNVTDLSNVKPKTNESIKNEIPTVRANSDKTNEQSNKLAKINQNTLDPFQRRHPHQKKIRFREYGIDDFEFLAVLGRGSFGKVLLAELINHDCHFAIKCLKKQTVIEDDDVESIMIERKVLAYGTSHPFICKLFCTFQTEGHLFFAMELCSGGDLMFHVQKEGKFPENKVKFYAAEILCAIWFLHKRGIIYRDLKLDNVMIANDGHIRLVDFGMCVGKMYREEFLPSNFCGTPEYMAPEIIKGVKYNHSVDYWALGVVIYEMCVGTSPFHGTDEDELLWNVCNTEVHYPKFLSEQVKNLCVLFLKKNPIERLGLPTSPYGDIISQPWFHGIQWDLFEKCKVKPPFIPQLSGDTDVSYFDQYFTKETPCITPCSSFINQNDQLLFNGFNYTNHRMTE